jgi:hypothetical protein
MVDGEEEGSPSTPPFRPGRNFQLLNALILVRGLLFWPPNAAELQGLFPPVVLWRIHFVMDKLLTPCTHLLYFITEQMYASNFCG